MHSTEDDTDFDQSNSIDAVRMRDGPGLDPLWNDPEFLEFCQARWEDRRFRSLFTTEEAQWIKRRNIKSVPVNDPHGSREKEGRNSEELLIQQLNTQNALLFSMIAEHGFNKKAHNDLMAEICYIRAHIKEKKKSLIDHTKSVSALIMPFECIFYLCADFAPFIWLKKEIGIDFSDHKKCICYAFVCSLCVYCLLLFFAKEQETKQYTPIMHADYQQSFSPESVLQN